MSEPPRLSARKEADRAARAERLARALRENLHRRRAQAKARADRAENSADAAAGLSQGPHSVKSNRQDGTTGG